MNWFTGIVVYLLIWWVSLFAVLPWGAKPSETPESGTCAGAPALPRLGRKFLFNTVLAAILWLVVFILVKIDIIDFYKISEQMMKEDGF